MHNMQIQMYAAQMAISHLWQVNFAAMPSWVRPTFGFPLPQPVGYHGNLAGIDPLKGNFPSW